MESRINYIKMVWLGANIPHIYFVSGPEALVSRRTNTMLSDFSSKIDHLGHLYKRNYCSSILIIINNILLITENKI